MSQNHVGTKLINKMFISIQELEAAINFWREQSPSRGEALQLCPQAAALAKPYAMMIIQSSQRVPMDGLSDSAQAAWKDSLSRKG
jgi:hypothetical protein